MVHVLQHKILYILRRIPVMTWDPLGVGDDWVAAVEVVTSEEIIEETTFTSSHLGHPQRIMQFTATG